MNRLFVVFVAMLCLAAAGCKPAPVPPPAAGEPAKRLPAISTAKIHMPLDAQGGSPVERKLEPGESVIPSSGCIVEITLAPSPDAEWYRSVRLDGAVPPYLEELTYRSVLQFAIPPGEPGTVLTLTLPPLEEATQTTYRLKRTARPSARLEVNHGGQWQAADPFQIYSEQGLALRYLFTDPMDRASVERSLQETVLGHHRFPGMGDAVLTWHNDRALEVRWTKAPPVVARSLVSAKAQNGLYVSGFVPGIHTGAAPYLAAVTPATGAERRVRELVPEGFYAQTARGGQVLRLDAYELRPGGYVEARSWLYDLKAGTSQNAEYLWNRYLLPTTGEAKLFKYDEILPPGYGLGPISPDGTQRIFVRPPKENLSPGVIASAALEVGLVDGNGRKVIYDGARFRMSQFERGPAVAWSPDGKQIIFPSAADEKSTDLVLLDLSSGGARKVATVPAFYSWSIPSPTVQWAGSRVLAGLSVVDLDSGKVLRSFPGAWATRWLSPDGRHVLLGTFDQDASDWGAWGPVTIVAVDSERDLAAGEGLPAGWSESGEAFIVRWEGWRYRFAPPGM